MFCRSPFSSSFTPKIGLEIHFQLRTKTKLFSAAPNTPLTAPNTAISKYDLGWPGVLPVVAQDAVELSLTAASILNASIPPVLEFDRKHYPYFDLPHGYQVTQSRKPIGVNGNLRIILSPKKSKNIPINFLALEEDTAKIKYDGTDALVDYNRHGVPLLEVVTAPNFTNLEEVKAFLNQLFSAFYSAGVSNCSLAQGSVRIDLNVSSSAFGLVHPRTEIKNLNSIANLEAAYQQEIDQQHAALKAKSAPTEITTKTFSESTQTIRKLRRKSLVDDYRFCPDFLLAPLKIDPQMIINAQKAWTKRGRSIENFFTALKSQPEVDQKFLIDHLACQYWYLDPLSEFVTFRTAMLFFREFFVPQSITDEWMKKNVTIVAKMLMIYESKGIDFNFVKKNLVALQKNSDWDVLNAIKQEIIAAKVVAVTPTEIQKIIKQMLVNDTQLITKWKQNPTATSRYLIGAILKKTKKAADPQLCQTVINQFFNEQ